MKPILRWAMVAAIIVFYAFLLIPAAGMILTGLYQAAYPASFPSAPSGNDVPAQSGVQQLINSSGFDHWFATVFFWVWFAIVGFTLFMMIRWFASSAYRDKMEQGRSFLPPVAQIMAFIGLFTAMQFTSEPKGLRLFLDFWVALIALQILAANPWIGFRKRAPASPEAPVSQDAI